jgi:hypothetical protein
LFSRNIRLSPLNVETRKPMLDYTTYRLSRLKGTFLQGSQVLMVARVKNRIHPLHPSIHVLMVTRDKKVMYSKCPRVQGLWGAMGTTLSF